MSWIINCTSRSARDQMCCMLLTHALQQLASLSGDSNELLVHHIDAHGT